MIKLDYLLHPKWLLRSFTNLDIPIGRSGGSLDGSSIYFAQRMELISRGGFLVAFDYMQANLSSSSNSALPPASVNRVDFRVGWKIRM
jgi:hypothetical protein